MADFVWLNNNYVPPDYDHCTLENAKLPRIGEERIRKLREIYKILTMGDFIRHIHLLEQINIPAENFLNELFGFNDVARTQTVRNLIKRIQKIQNFG